MFCSKRQKKDNKLDRASRFGKQSNEPSMFGDAVLVEDGYGAHGVEQY